MIKTTLKTIISTLAAGAIVIQAYNVVADAPEGADNAPVQSSETQLVAKLIAISEQKDLGCEQLVSKIDEQIIEIDLKLDSNPSETGNLLAERGELVAFRLSQPCHTQVVTPVAECCGHAVSLCECPPPVEVFSEVLIEEIPCEEILLEEVIVEEVPLAAPMMGCGYASACGGGFGGGGGGGFGGGGVGLLGLAGLAGLAGLGDDKDIIRYPR